MTAGSYCRQQDSKLNYIIQTRVFRGVDPSLIVCVELSIYELNFTTDKGYCVKSSGKKFVASSS
jgi:hypothetical protein